MRVLEGDLCDEPTINKASSMVELISALSEFQRTVKKKSYAEKGRIEEQLELKEKLI